MGRKIEFGYSLEDLANRVAKGQRFELSAIPVGDEHRLFFREIGKFIWQSVVWVTKEGPFSYKSKAIGSLLMRAKADLPGAPISFYFDGSMYNDSRRLEKLFDVIAAKYRALGTRHQLTVKTILAAEDQSDEIVLWLIERRLTYPIDAHPELDEGSNTVDLDIIRRFLGLPEDLDTLLSEMP